MEELYQKIFDEVVGVVVVLVFGEGGNTIQNTRIIGLALKQLELDEILKHELVNKVS